jgi:hypothetical protein
MLDKSVWPELRLKEMLQLFYFKVYYESFMV